MVVLLVKSFHLIFMVTWFAGLFYLPRLFVYHAAAKDETGIARFKVMERRLLWGITTPGGVLTIFFGLWLLALYPDGTLARASWLQWKLVLVGLLVAYHGWCIRLWLHFRRDCNRHGPVWYRWFNEAPVLVLVAVVLLAVCQPDW